MVEQSIESGTLDAAMLNDVLTIDQLQTQINDLHMHRMQDNEDTLRLLVRAVDLLTELVGRLETRIAALESACEVPQNAAPTP